MLSGNDLASSSACIFVLDLEWICYIIRQIIRSLLCYKKQISQRIEPALPDAGALRKKQRSGGDYG
jgi:hypothetical protein